MRFGDAGVAIATRMAAFSCCGCFANDKPAAAAPPMSKKAAPPATRRICLPRCDRVMTLVQELHAGTALAGPADFRLDRAALDDAQLDDFAVLELVVAANAASGVGQIVNEDVAVASLAERKSRQGYWSAVSTRYKGLRFLALHVAPLGVNGLETMPIPSSRDRRLRGVALVPKAYAEKVGVGARAATCVDAQTPPECFGVDGQSSFRRGRV